MPPNWDRRRQGDGRERYPALRLYAKMINLTGFAGLVVGVIFAVLVLLFAEEPLLDRVAHSAMALGAAGACFIVVRAAAEIFFLLLDVARNLNATRDLVEKQMAGRRRKQS